MAHTEAFGSDVQRAAESLRKGGLVAIPTETVYGLGANATDDDAVLRIFEAKGRPAFDPLIVHIGSLEQLHTVVSSFPEKARLLAQAYWPGPLTFILPKQDSISDLVTSGLPTVGVRMPRHSLTLQLLQSLPFPLAAPSANPFGYISPTTVAHVQAQLGDKLDYILDGGACEVGLESTIVGFENGGVQVLRLGGLSVEEIEAVAGPVSVANSSTSNPTAPGMLSSHYAPGKPLLFGEIDSLLSEHVGKNFQLLVFRDLHGQPGKVLSASGNMNEAARNLFSMLRELDASDCSIILAEKVPNEGLGRAINDRLNRASSRR